MKNNVCLEFIVQVLDPNIFELNSFLETFGCELFYDFDHSLILAMKPHYSISMDYPDPNPYTLNGKHDGYTYLKFGDRIQCKNYDITIVQES